MIKNACDCVAHVKHHSVQGAVLAVFLHQPAQALRVTERRQGTVDCSNDLAEKDLVWRPP